MVNSRGSWMKGVCKFSVFFFLQLFSKSKVFSKESFKNLILSNFPGWINWTSQTETQEDGCIHVSYDSDTRSPLPGSIYGTHFYSRTCSPWGSGWTSPPVAVRVGRKSRWASLSLRLCPLGDPGPEKAETWSRDGPSTYPSQYAQTCLGPWARPCGEMRPFFFHWCWPRRHGFGSMYVLLSEPCYYLTGEMGSASSKSYYLLGWP